MLPRTLGLPLIAILLIASPAQSQQNHAQLPPCKEPQEKQFDFWVGEWDLTWPGRAQGEVAHGSNSIKRTLDGCVVEEQFSGGDAMSLRGMSVSTFDARAGLRTSLLKSLIGVGNVRWTGAKPGRWCGQSTTRENQVHKVMEGQRDLVDAAHLRQMVCVKG